jgi:hypothetical protein
MVSYEIFVVYASIVALRTGSVNLIWRHEATLHGLCCAAGVIAFIGFYTMADRYQTQFTEAASVRQGYARQQQALSDYDALVASMVQVWLVLLFGMLTLWAYQRFVLFARLQRNLSASKSQYEAAVEADLLASLSRGTELRRTLLELQNQGWREIAKPLDPYIVVFIAFGLPAAVMGTTVCEDESVEAEHVVSCQHVCEMVLSFRTLATSAVYFSKKECREQLFAFKLLLSKVGGRACGTFLRLAGIAADKRSTSGKKKGGVRFEDSRALEEIQMIPARGFDDDGNQMVESEAGQLSAPGPRRDRNRPVSRADADVQMMGANSLAVLLDMDDDAYTDSAAGSLDLASGGSSAVPYMRME